MIHSQKQLNVQNWPAILYVYANLVVAVNEVSAISFLISDLADPAPHVFRIKLGRIILSKKKKTGEN